MLISQTSYQNLFQQNSICFKSKQKVSSRCFLIHDKDVSEKVILMQRNKNLPITTNPEEVALNELIKKAQSGDKQALSDPRIKSLIDSSRVTAVTRQEVKYNFWDYPRVYRFVSWGEIKNLLKGKIIAPQRYFDEVVDVTNNPNGWGGAYKITFKLKDNLNPLFKNNSKEKGIPYVKFTKPFQAQHHLFGGYSLDDVECIEKTAENGTKYKLNIPPDKQKFLDAIKFFKSIR